MHEVCTPACIFIFIFIFTKKNNLPTSKSCNLVKEKKLIALENLSANFMSVVLPIDTYIPYIHTYITPDRYIHLVYILGTLYMLYIL